MAVAVATLAAVLIFAFVAFAANVDGQSKEIGDDLDRGRLRQYGVVE